MLLFFPFHFGSGEDCGAAVSTGVRFTLTYSADRLETLVSTVSENESLVISSRHETWTTRAELTAKMSHQCGRRESLAECFLFYMSVIIHPDYSL